jgi:SPX domain protein involved in polyphosphate accumulation
MRESSVIDEKENQRVEAAQEWLRKNCDNISGIEQKLAGGDEAGFPAPTMSIKRKTRRKDDGPVEILCGWIVEHQIGMSVLLQSTAHSTNKYSRSICQLAHASKSDTHVFPPSTSTYSKVLRALLLQ